MTGNPLAGNTVSDVVDEPLRGENFEFIMPADTAEIDSLFNEADQFKRLGDRTVNPYLLPRKSTVDLSELDPEIAAKVTALAGQKNKNYAAFNRKSIPWRQFRKLIFVVGRQGDLLDKRVFGANEELIAFVKDTFTPVRTRFQESNEPIGISELQAVIDQFNQLAQSTPSKNSLEVLETLEGAAAARSRSTANTVRREGRTGSLTESMNRKRGAIAERQIKRIEQNLAIIGKNAASTYQNIQNLIRGERAKRAFYVLDIVEEIKNELQKAFNDELSLDIARKLEAQEEALAAYAVVAERIIKEALPEIKGDEEAETDMGQLKKRPLAEHIAKLRQERAADLGKAVTEASEIILGGRRLKPNKRVRNPGELADQLSSVLAGEAASFRVESGLMVAILSGRFETFVNTVSRVKAEASSDVIDTLKQQRSRLIETLQALDLGYHLENIAMINEVYKEVLVEAIGSDCLDKIALQIARYKEAQTEQPAADSATS